MNRHITILSFIALVIVVLSGFVWYQNQTMNQKSNSSNINNTIQNNNPGTFSSNKESINPKEGQPIKDFYLVAKESKQEIKTGLSLPVWTYNGSIPGTEIRVTEGDFVRVHLTNILDEPITIHWHGYPVKSQMDGIPGYTQDAILPGESFVYEFSADYTGTYWYHSHQESSKQVDKGLYGALIVEPKVKDDIDKDYTLLLDEWMDNPENEMMMSGSETDTMMGTESAMADTEYLSDSSENSPDPVMEEEQMMKEQYNIFTVNGKSGDLITPLEVNKGDTVKLRFINAGYRSHGIHIPGQIIKVVSTDGQEIPGAGEIKDQILSISPGERYDVVFTVTTDDSFIIDAHDDNLFNDQLRIPVHVNGGSSNYLEETNVELTNFDLSVYGSGGHGEFNLNQNYDVEQYIQLNTKVEGGSVQYTINGKVFSELIPVTVKTGDTVKLTYENKSSIDHPMHLHGHFFQVLSKNNKPFQSVITKDTLLVKPGEKYVIAFKADNPGLWVQHCHELHHAAGGMMQKVVYSDYESDYIPNPANSYNNPE